MRTRPILTASLALNVLLVLLWLVFREEPAPQRPAEGAEPALGNGEIRTNTVVRRQFFSWEELESEDYTTYIANLRSISCPEETIRDIIIADVDDLFVSRRSTQTIPTAQQWWQSEPDPVVLQLANRQAAALEAERDRLLTKLLGPDWDVPTTPVPTVAIKVPLEGPLLSSLPPETRDAVQSVSGRMQRQFEQLLMLSGGAGPEPAGVAALERQLRNELSTLLSPSQLEEFLLRYSPSAQQLRSELASVALFNATDLETRTIFRNLRQIELELMSLGDGPGDRARREGLLRDREIAFRNALGPARYRELERLQDPAFESAVAAAVALGVTSAADLFYAIDRVGEMEKADIMANTGLTPLQKEMALRQLELEQTQTAAAALGEAELPKPTPPPVPQRTFTFQEGDDIRAVSMRFRVPVRVLLQANPGLQPDGIPPGTRIIIPERFPIPPSP